MVYMLHMIYWGLPRGSDGLTHRVYLCGARSLYRNHRYTHNPYAATCIRPSIIQGGRGIHVVQGGRGICSIYDTSAQMR